MLVTDVRLMDIPWSTSHGPLNDNAGSYFLGIDAVSSPLALTPCPLFPPCLTAAILPSPSAAFVDSVGCRLAVSELAESSTRTTSRQPHQGSEMDRDILSRLALVD